MIRHAFTGVILGGVCLACAAPALAADKTAILSQLRQADGTIGVRQGPVVTQQALPATTPSDPNAVETVNWHPPTWMQAPTHPAFSANATPSSAPKPWGLPGNWSLSTTLGWDSEQIFRGQQMAKQNAMAGVEAGWNNYYAGAYAYVPTADAWDSYPSRVDVYGGTTFDISGNVYGDVGMTGYFYPDEGNVVPVQNSVEAYFGIGLDHNVFSPTLYGYYDMARDRYTVEASGEYRLPVGRTDLVLGGTAGVTGGYGLDYFYLRGDAEVEQNINRFVSVGIGAHYAWSSENTFLNGLAFTEDQTEWFGIRLKARKD